MPIYEYECERCKKIFEVMQKFSDEPLKVCPECGAPVKKVMSLTSFSLKGSGWYSSGYQKQKKDVGPPSEKATDKKESPTPKEKSKETKPVKKEKTS